MAGRDSEAANRGGALASPVGEAARDRIAENARLLGDLAGKAWNAPNTILGLAYGTLGHLAGQVNRFRPGRPVPRIRVGHNAVEFLNNPAGGIGAITIGNTITYSDDPYERGDERYMAHERAHTIQGQQLGPLYLPSNAAGLLLSALRRERDPDGGITGHGPSNWNERGPQMDPPRPWPPRRGR